MTSLQCAICKHYDGLQECPAFEEKIPEDIFTGLFDHTKIHPEQDDDTYLFEADDE